VRYINESLISQVLYYHEFPKELDWPIDGVGMNAVASVSK